MNNDILTSQRSAPAKFVNAVPDHWKQSLPRMCAAIVSVGLQYPKRVKLQKEAKPLREENSSPVDPTRARN